MGSSDYYNLYKHYKGVYSTLKSNKKSVDNILSHTQNYLNDDITRVNNEIEDLVSDLNAAVRYTTFVTTTITQEPGVYTDTNTSSIISNLNAESSSLAVQMNDANTNMNYYYQLYLQAKRQEEEEFWRRLLEAQKNE